MARWAGYKEAVEFALVVEAWTQEERRSCLDRFYAWRRKVLAGDEGLKDEALGLSKLDTELGSGQESYEDVDEL